MYHETCYQIGNLGAIQLDRPLEQSQSYTLIGGPSKARRFFFGIERPSS